MRPDRNAMSLLQATKLLELKRGDEKEIKANFQRLALKAHPDKGGSTEAMNDLLRARKACLEDIKRTIVFVFFMRNLNYASQNQ